MKATDFVGIIVISLFGLIGYVYHENKVHPSPASSSSRPWYVLFEPNCNPSVSAIKFGDTYICSNGATLTLQPMTNGTLAVCSCPSNP